MAAWSADAVITHSPDEAGMLRQAMPKLPVHVVTWAVAPQPTMTPFADRKGVAFIGGYSHAPNPDAAHWLIENVMPLVWQADPDIPCLLVGAEMPPSLLRLGDERIFPLGHVDDLAESVFGRVRLTVAPLRFGAGVKGKVLESFAAGLPCVMSPIAAEGLALTPVLKLLVGNNAAALAGLILQRHGNEAANRTATEAGLDLIRRDFNAEVTMAALKDAIEGNVV